LTAEQIDKATRLMAAKWRKSGRLALVGGAAMQFYGSDRFTKDVDFIADDTAPADSDMAFVCALSFGGKRYVALDVPIDVIVRSDDSAKLYGEALDNAEETEEGFLIVSPEYLAAMKFDAMRAKDEADLMWLLGQRGLVNLRKAEDIVRRHLGGQRAGREFRQLVNEARWRADEGEFEGKATADHDHKIAKTKEES
jgi:hypothetical protein